MKQLARRAFVLPVTLLLGVACRHTNAPSETRNSAAAPSATEVTPSAVAAGDRLPEDPAAAQRSSAQWREHMAEEEHERRLSYDRRKLPQHRALLALLLGAQARYERARSEREVNATRASMSGLAAEARRRVEAIDHWGVNSNLLSDYSALLDLLAEPYAQAKIAALGGASAALEASRAEFDAHRRKVEAWLSEAAASEDD